MLERDLYLAALEIDDPEKRASFIRKRAADDKHANRVLAMVEYELSDDDDLDSDALFGGSPLRYCDFELEDLGVEVGATIGRYKLLEEIGEGGCGMVFMAEQIEPVSRRVALKVIKPGMDTRHVIARFEAERQALALMDHPNIARVLDAGSTSNGRPYFAMELVKGHPITRFCEENQTSIRERLTLFLDVCQAVQHAHQKGIIHRDLKPTNVLVTLRSGKATPKVIDFGIAKAIDQKLTERTLFTRFNQVVGTPAYMSPEQAQTSDIAVDTRSDVYSLGVLLYELLTGEPPLDGQYLRTLSNEELARTIREDDPPTPSSRISTMSGDAIAKLVQFGLQKHQLSDLLRGDLDWVVMRAIEKQPDRRYQDVASLAEDIRHHLADRPVTAGPPASTYRMWKFVRRNRVLVASSAAIVSCLLMATIVSLFSWSKLRVTVDHLVASREDLQKTVNKLEQSQTALSQTAANERANYELWRDMLASVGPDAPMRTVVDMVDKFVTELPERLKGKSVEFRASHVTELGNLYMRLGEQRKAFMLYKAVTDELEPQADSLHDSLLLPHAFVRLAESAVSCCRTEEAIAASQKAVNVLGSQDGELLDQAQALLKASNRMLEVQSLLNEYMVDCRHHLIVDEVAEIIQEDQDFKPTGVINHAVVMLFADTGRFDDARLILHRTKGLRKSKRGLIHANVRIYHEFLFGYLCEKTGDNSAASEHFQNVIDLRTSVSQRNSDNNWVQQLCADALLRKDDITEAELEDAASRIQLCLDQQEYLKTIGIEVAGSVFAIAIQTKSILEQKRGDLQAAIEFQQTALNTCRGGDDTPQHMLLLLDMEERLCELHQLDGNQQRAERIASEAISWRQQKLSADHYQIKAAYSRLSRFVDSTVSVASEPDN